MKQKRTNNKLYQTSLFLIMAATNSSAFASTCSPGFYDPANGSACIPAELGKYVPNAGATTAFNADPGYFVNLTGSSTQTPSPPGYYVPISGASEAIPAAPGFFVANSGESSQTPAPAGYYVPGVAALSAIPAPIGYYVPTTGAASATPVSRGFYTAQQASDAQMPAGGLAAPLTATLQTSNLFNTLATELLNSNGTSTFKLATSYQNHKAKQIGLSNGDFNTHLGAFVLQANLLKRADGNTGLQASYGHHNLKNSTQVSNNGNSFEIAAFNSGALFQGRYQAFAVYGQTRYDNSRNVVVNAAGTQLETLKTSGIISWTGARSHITYPVIERFNVLSHFGALRYSTEGISETGSATLNGAPTTSIAALNAQSLNYISTPYTFGVVYDILPKLKDQFTAPITLETGVIGNFSGKKSLKLSSASGAEVNLPITQTSAVAGYVALKANGWKLDNGFNVAGAIQLEHGADSTAVRAGINLVKTW